MSARVADNKINGGYVPRHFLSDGDYAFFVNGYTSDVLKDWTLRVAPLLPNGQPDMNKTDLFMLCLDWPKLDEGYGDLSLTQVTELTLLVGNTQRACQGLPTL